MPTDLTFTDGYLGTEQEISVAPQVSYPFGANPVPDVVHRRTARQFQVAPRRFTPKIATRTAYTNLLLQSNNFAAAAWVKTGLAISTANAVNPWDGATTTDYLVETAVTSLHSAQQNIALAASTRYCLSAIVFAGGRSQLLLELGKSGPAFAHVLFDLTNFSATLSIGIAGGGSGSAGIIDLGGGWVQPWVSYNNLSASSYALVQLSDGTTGAYLGDVFRGIFVANVMLEMAASPGPLIITAGSARTISAPNTDYLANSGAINADPFGYLVSESDAQIENSARALFTRLYARIPANQIFPATKYITRPVLHGIKSGTAYAVCFDDEQKFSWIFTSRKSVSAIGTPNVTDTTETNTKALLPGGITINLAGHNGTTGTTGSFNTSDSIATIQTAVFNIWTHATVSVTKDAYGISCKSVYSGTGGGSITQVDATASSAVEVSGDPTDFTIVAATAATATVRTIHAVGHGGVAGDRVALWNNDKLLGTTVVAAVLGADDITIPIDALPGKDDVVTHVAFSTDAASCVVNGTIMCSIRRTQKYFLPGVTAGITTFADIPVAASQMDPISWLAAIIAGSAWVVESVGELAPASGLGPMLMQETLEVQMSDAVDTVTP